MGQKEREYSILEELAKCSGYDLALMTTFNFEIGFFERAVLNRLLARDVKTVSLFADSKELITALNEFDFLHSGSNIGRRYMVTPVKMDGSFHPKVILLLGEKKARLFVGSANIKTSGYATNNEVFNCIDYDANHPERLDVIVAAIDFFDAINEISFKLDNGVIAAAKKYIYYHKAGKNDETYLLHNMKKSILEQVAEIVPKEVTEISIAVPYYDKELLALRQVKDLFPNAVVNLYVQDKTSTFPVSCNEKNHVADKVNVFSRFLDNSSTMSGNFYHGKVFMFRTNDKAYVLYGSANCTLSALVKTHSDGGNVECDFLEVGAADEFDYFFDNMDLDEKEKPSSQEMTYEPLPSSVFSFKFGEVKERIELHIACPKVVNDLVVSFGDKELEYKMAEGEIIVFIDEECQDKLTDIFEITLTYGDQTEVIRCWTFSRVVLSNNRKAQNRREDFDDFEIESEGNKFIEDRRKYLNAEATCFNDVQEQKNHQKYLNQIKLEQEEASNEPEDFIVDYQIPDEYRLAYRRYSEVSRIRSIFVKRFLGFSSGLNVNEDKEIKESSVRPEPGPIAQIGRKATSEEKEFERFVKGKVKSMMSDLYIKAIEFEHYVGLVEIILEIFVKYRHQENVEDIFLPDYVAETKIKFMRTINEKLTEDTPNKADFQHSVIVNSVAAMLETYLYYRNLSEPEERWKFESLNKRLLQDLEMKYRLRQSYAPYVKEVIRAGKGGVLTLGSEKACGYIEQLYGYKTFEMLEKAIDEVYPNAKIDPKGSTITIDFDTDCISNYWEPNKQVLKEIANYGRKVTKINTVYINVWNANVDLKKGNSIRVIRHVIDMGYSHRWTHCEVLVNGKRIESKPAFLTF